MQRVVVSIVLLVLAPFAHAQQKDTIYRCTDARGALTIQNGTPCPKGSKQQVQVIEAPTVIPRYVAPPAIVTTVPRTDAASPATRCPGPGRRAPAIAAAGRACRCRSPAPATASTSAAPGKTRPTSARTRSLSRAA